MSGQLPKGTIDVLRSFNDLALAQFGITCTLYIPTNLTSVESMDMYQVPEDHLTYTTYRKQPLWIEFHVTNIHRLRKLGIYVEGENPIIARFKNDPQIVLNSYIVIDTRYIPDNYDTDEFEVTDIITTNMYDSEIYTYCKMNPRRKK